MDPSWGISDFTPTLVESEIMGLGSTGPPPQEFTGGKIPCDFKRTSCGVKNDPQFFLLKPVGNGSF